MHTNKGLVVLVPVATAIVPSAWALPAAATPSPTPGVTASTIRVGIPYVDLSSLAALGIKLNQGSFPDAYNAMIANLNAHGGINGRKVVPYLVAVNPTGTAAASTACTQLTEDDKVFVALAPLSPNCYLQQHHTPTIQAQAQVGTSAGSAPNFTLEAPAAAYDPLQVAVFDKEGVFKGKKVGVYGGTTADEQELSVVQSALKKLHVNVVVSALNAAPATDQTVTEVLGGLHEAIVSGVPVLGYLHWSLLDNFEWTRGYVPRFGLIAVDRTDFARTPKASAEHLGEIARRNALWT